MNNTFGVNNPNRPNPRREKVDRTAVSTDSPVEGSGLLSRKTAARPGAGSAGVQQGQSAAMPQAGALPTTQGQPAAPTAPRGQAASVPKVSDIPTRQGVKAGQQPMPSVWDQTRPTGIQSGGIENGAIVQALGPEIAGAKGAPKMPTDPRVIRQMMVSGSPEERKAATETYERRNRIFAKFAARMLIASRQNAV